MTESPANHETTLDLAMSACGGAGLAGIRPDDQTIVRDERRRAISKPQTAVGLVKGSEEPATTIAPRAKAKSRDLRRRAFKLTAQRIEREFRGGRPSATIAREIGVPIQTVHKVIGRLIQQETTR